MDRYYAPAGAGDYEFIEKRSKFTACVFPVDSEDAAKEAIAHVRAKNHDASHNCWCYIIRGGTERYSDDGEPQGTAGLPMLEVFRRGGITNVCCIVTRYFGGVLLGSGGLSRAYSTAAKLALTNAGTAEFRRCDSMNIKCRYDLIGRIKPEIESHKCVIANIEYGENVIFSVLVPEGRSNCLCERLRDISAGTVSCDVTGSEYMRESPELAEK